MALQAAEQHWVLLRLLMHHQPGGCRGRSVLRGPHTEKLYIHKIDVEPMLLPVGPTEPRCSSTLLPHEATEALGNQAFDSGLN